MGAIELAPDSILSCSKTRAKLLVVCSTLMKTQPKADSLVLSNTKFSKVASKTLSYSIKPLFMKLLFVCSKNRLRSPTAEAVFAGYEGLEVDSAGLDREAEILLSSEAIQWADIIFVMEKSHRSKLSRKFQSYLKCKRVICLDIPDEYEYMESALVELLKRKVMPLLGTF
ncbi:low molecular weight protein tyrosine phosphatase family protein [Phormidium sp. CLA17]|uniref:low molecular weight protein tyrosine phosphatase family protein n=1 Tax=Leptolyngbya sp. Cla-17 TaxID=2803751 RepID=UPI0018D628AF|nr:low molecular weight protein tyrosine phosphatase family protein [Leptolyngbya sp. Cla-17]MBM0742673.1 low molecular weight protein tyrosine phosphatase family protein [Leptolyngbya sp. Cla-17]